MFFILSKILGFLQNPLSWILILLFVGWMVKNMVLRKKIWFSAVILLILASNEFIVNRCILAWEIPPIYLNELKPKYKAIVVLTGITSPGKLPNDRVHVLSSPDRLLHSLLLFKKGFSDRIIISGGSGSLFGNKISEAEELKQVLVLAGVPDSCILLEEKSRNTFENAKETAKIIHKNTIGDDFILVTSAFHMRRSMACFKKQNLHPQPFSVNHSILKGDPMEWDKVILPNVYALPKWQMMIHEYLGYISYWASGYL